MEQRRERSRLEAEVRVQDERVNQAFKKKILLRKRHRDELRSLEDEITLELETKTMMEEELQRGVGQNLPSNQVYRMKCGANGCTGHVNNQCMCPVCGQETCEECWKVKSVDRTEKQDGEEDTTVRVKLSLTFLGRLANRTVGTGGGREKRYLRDEASWVDARLIVAGTHHCDETDVSTVRMIKETSRPCPRCGISISKTDGCDQMHCIACRHTFSWTSGATELGRVHNPEHFRMEREGRRGFMEREIGDVPCGGFPSRGEMENAMTGQNRYIIDYFWNAVRVAENVSRTMTQYATGAKDRDYKDLHVEMLLGGTSLEKFQRQVRQRVEQRGMKDKIRPVLSTWVMCVQDLTNRVMQEGREAKRMVVRWGGREVSQRVQVDVDKYQKELEQLVQMANLQLAKISEYHGRRVPLIPDDFHHPQYPIVEMVRYGRREP